MGCNWENHMNSVKILKSFAFGVVVATLFGHASARAEGTVVVYCGVNEEWCRAAAVAGSLRSSRIGVLGHTYPGMLDMYSDPTMVSAQDPSNITSRS